MPTDFIARKQLRIALNDDVFKKPNSLPRSFPSFRCFGRPIGPPVSRTWRDPRFTAAEIAAKNRLASGH
jgi:hypothetical protein